MVTRKQEQDYIDRALDKFEQWAKEYHRKYRKKGKVPKNYVWRPYRFCVQDVILGMVVVRHLRKDNLLEVDVCLSTDVNIFPLFTGAKIVTAFLLSEAFKCGGSMEIRFTSNVQGGRVPTDICDLALELDIELHHVFAGHITPAEARKLYLGVTEFSEEAVQKIMQLSVEDKISPERVCYMVHHGVWTLEGMESILLGSESPERLLLGKFRPEMRHLYLNNLLHARAALLGDFLDRKLARRKRGDEKRAIELESDQRRIEVTFDPRFYAKAYQSREPLPVPWVDGRRLTVPPHHRLVVLVRPRTAAGLRLYFHQDLKTAKEMGEAYARSSEKPVYGFILVPRDFEDLPPGERQEMRSTARESNILIITCPETVQALDEDAAHRIERSRTLRR